MKVIKGRKIVTPAGLLDGHIVVEGRTITQVAGGPLPEAAACGMVVDAGEHYIAPGFIDIHVHGGGGHDFMDGTVECIEEAARAHLLHGTTSMVPTTLTSTQEELFRTIDRFRMAQSLQKDGPCLLGLHLEGPYLSMEQRGAQDPQYIKNPSREEYEKILDYAQGAVIRWTVAPELSGAVKMGDHLRARGVIPSIGHSNAEYCHVKEAFEHGYHLITHYYCGMSGLVRREGYRRLGVIESGYLLDEMDVEVIADGCHLPPELLRLIYKGKGREHIILVTDSMRGAGMGPGRSILGSLEHGQEVVIEDGVAKLPDRSAFAGSVACADRLVRVMHQEAGIDLLEAVAMMTKNPARVLGLKTKGEIREGMDADLIVFDSDIQVKAAMVGGAMRFCRI